MELPKKGNCLNKIDQMELAEKLVGQNVISHHEIDKNKTTKLDLHSAPVITIRTMKN